MRLLVIDNGSKLINKLVAALSTFELEKVSYTNIKDVSNQTFDAAVLSGGSLHPAIKSHDFYQDEVDFIRTFNKPLIGICLGFELINLCYGGKLKRLHTKERGVFPIAVLGAGKKIFNNHNKLEVYKSHHWAVDKIPKDFEVIASMGDEIEAIKHKSKPIIGTQFHPEVENDGKLLKQIVTNNLH